MTDTTLLTSIASLSRLMTGGSLSSGELVRYYLDRIASYNDSVNAFISLCEEEALKTADGLDVERASGKIRSPLHGIPIAVKDLFDVKNTVTTGGSMVYETFVSGNDAQVVSRLKDAGAVILGKLNMNEFAFGITGKNPGFGDVINPVDPARLTGGSSSGSAAAVKAGLIPLALGTDTGGSIRIPSALCGITGFKPTYGLVDKTGVLPLSWSLDHVGPMAKTVEDLVCAMAVMAKKEGEDSIFTDTTFNKEDADVYFKGKTVGIFTPFLERSGYDVKEAIKITAENFRNLGAELSDVTIEGISEAELSAFTILFSEAAASIETHVLKSPGKISPDVLENTNIGMTIPAFKYVHAQRVRARFIKKAAALFENVDIVLAPVTPVAAPLSDAETVAVSPGDTTDVRSALTRFTRLFNFSGNPSLTFPVSATSNGLPVNIQLVGKHFMDQDLLYAGAAYQESFPFPSMIPHSFL